MEAALPSCVVGIDLGTTNSAVAVGLSSQACWPALTTMLRDAAAALALASRPTTSAALPLPLAKRVRHSGWLF